MTNENTILALAKINSTPAVMTFSYAEAKAALSAYLDKYRNVIISEDGAKEGKELIAEINTTRKELDRRRKEAVAEANAPIKLFDQQMKELVGMCDELKDAIRLQTDKYDNEQKAKAKELLTAFLFEQWESLGVENEFQAAEIDDLVMLSAITAKGNLTGKSKAEVTARANSDLALQNTVALRLKDLEAQSYKAGLSVPLSKNVVAYFINTDENTYQQKLQEILAGEVEREARAKALRESEEKARLENEERLRIQAEQEAEQRRLNDLAEAEKRHQAELEAQLVAAQNAAQQAVVQHDDIPFPDSSFDDVYVDESDFEGFEPDYEQAADMSAYQAQSNTPNRVIGTGGCGGAATIKLSFTLPESATEQDVKNEITTALATAGLSAYVADIEIEILPF